ncbi:MAG: electron transfer flavoprotein subunit beta/FixA family protein, partial [Acidobacteria bacterium]|nr:electron transfer flavoprotein subunit beta/FixA family protein [Acidobacteriota bacterium]
MRIAVCIKQVPDTEARLRVGKDGRWLDEEDLPFILNESDGYALEEALRLAEASGGEVVLFSLGPERVKEALRKGLALGAHKAVHLSDDAFAGGDALATARALHAAIARESFDLVLTGSQSDDVGYGGTGSVLAGHLGWPHAWLVMGVEVEEGGQSLRVVREMESGMNEIL